MVQNIDTLEVDQLLQSLEGAIASGNIQKAAGFAQNLAEKKLSIHCSMKEKAKSRQNVDMVLRSRSIRTKGRPKSLQLSPTMTVAQLKKKIFEDFQIPAKIQRWKIKQDFVDDDEVTLKELEAFEGSPLSLSIAVPKFWIAYEVNGGATDGENESENMKEENETDIDKSESENDHDEVDSQQNMVVNDETPEIPMEQQIDEKNDDLEVTIESNVDEQERENEDENLVQLHDDKMDGDGPLMVNLSQENEELTQNNNDGASASFQLKEINDLIQMECYEVLPNADAIECPICLSIFEPAEGVILHECRHGFCWDCISATIKHCEDAEVKCPYVDDENTCMSFLQEREIKALVDEEVYEKHLAKSLSMAENKAGTDAFHCKTPDCKGWCFNDEDVRIFHCPVCDKSNCLTCRANHEGKTCWDYQDEVRLMNDPAAKKSAELLLNMLNQGEAMTCPYCGAIVMKVEGCDGLVCTFCKSNLCWATKGARWGPGGSGDTSGGCRCSVNGKRCHPNCRNCH